MGKIKIYTDEDVDVAVAAGLKNRGIEAWSTRDAGNLTLKDEEQLEYALNHDAVIFTHDDDFLRIAAKWNEDGREHAGIIYVHRRKLSTGKCIRAIELIVDVMDSEEMKNHVEFL